MDNMHEEKGSEEQMKKKMDADLLVPMQDFDPSGNRIYHPVLWKKAVLFGITGGVIFTFIFWMIAAGYWPVMGLGQISSAQHEAAAFMGFSLGSAIGALTGSLVGLNQMLKMR